MIVYKMFRVMKDGTLSSLFINKKARYKLNEKYTAGFYPTKGYTSRMGFHSVGSPNAPHLTLKGRAWFECEIEDFTKIQKPLSQGGQWYISKTIKIIKQL